MPNDIAPNFRKLIRKLPESWLYEMRHRLTECSECIKQEDVRRAVKLDINTELLRRKWGGKRGR